MYFDNLEFNNLANIIKNNSSIFKSDDIDTFLNMDVIPIGHNDLGNLVFVSPKNHDFNNISNIKFIVGKDVEILKIENGTYLELRTYINNSTKVFNKTSNTKIEVFKVELDDSNDNIRTIQYLNGIIEEAIKTNASDIHIEPQKNYIRVRFRVDGKLIVVHKLDLSLLSLIITRFKIISSLDISERRLPQDGRITFNYENREIDLRISIIPMIYGEKIVLRILDSHLKFDNLTDLGMNEKMQEVVLKSIKKSNGLILVCGPIGSGKTSSIYSMLKILNNEDVNITTIEDPIEYKLDGINQIQVNYKTGLEFELVLQHILRNDPNILNIGEIRDNSTVKIALRASLIGHLVFSTVHSRSSVLAIDRLLDLNAERYLLSNALQLVISQRLIRRLCNHCKTTETVLCEYFQDPVKLYFPTGCDNCKDGYVDRIGVFEYLQFDDKIRNMIINKSSTEDILNEAKSNGFITLEDQFKEMLLNGTTSLDEVRRNS